MSVKCPRFHPNYARRMRRHSQPAVTGRPGKGFGEKPVPPRARRWWRSLAVQSRLQHAGRRKTPAAAALSDARTKHVVSASLLLRDVLCLIPLYPICPECQVPLFYPAGDRFAGAGRFWGAKGVFCRRFLIKQRKSSRNCNNFLTSLRPRFTISIVINSNFRERMSAARRFGQSEMPPAC